MKTYKILFTGFEPFGGEPVNPSWEAVALLPEEQTFSLPDSTQQIQLLIAKRRLPVAFGEVGELISRFIREERPDAVICVGQAGGRSVLTPELVAINRMDAAAPDNAGRLCTDEPIRADGPAAYFSTLPVKAIVRDMKAAGVPAELSLSAGTYVCNCLMYHLLDCLSQASPAIPAGFIHIPYECSQAASHGRAVPSLPVTLMRDGLLAAARTVASL